MGGVIAQRLMSEGGALLEGMHVFTRAGLVEAFRVNLKSPKYRGSVRREPRHFNPTEVLRSI